MDEDVRGLRGWSTEELRELRRRQRVAGTGTEQEQDDRVHIGRLRLEQLLGKPITTTELVLRECADRAVKGLCDE